MKQHEDSLREDSLHESDDEVVHEDHQETLAVVAEAKDVSGEVVVESVVVGVAVVVFGRNDDILTSDSLASLSSSLFRYMRQVMMETDSPTDDQEDGKWTMMIQIPLLVTLRWLLDMMACLLP